MASPLLAVAFIALNVFCGLALESYGAARGWPYTEVFVAIVTSLHLAYYFIYPSRLLTGDTPISRMTLLICLILATLGEFILSAGFGLYQYRASVLPLFVPPGHVLLFIAGLLVADQKWLSPSLPWFIMGLAGVCLGYFALQGQDLLSLPLFFLFLICVVWGSERRLYSVMFALALALEFCGTAFETWHWRPHISSLGISAANPPLAAGALYACLDLLTVRIRRRFVKANG